MINLFTLKSVNNLIRLNSNLLEIVYFEFKDIKTWITCQIIVYLLRRYTLWKLKIALINDSFVFSCGIMAFVLKCDAGTKTRQLVIEMTNFWMP